MFHTTKIIIPCLFSKSQDRLNVILEAIHQNPSFQLVFVKYGGINVDSLDDDIKDIEDLFISKDKDTLKVKRNVNIVSDSFKNFTDNFLENKTYSNKNHSNEPFQ